MQLLFTRYYDVHGLRLNVEAENAFLAESLESVLSPFAISANGADGYRVALSFGKPSLDAEKENLRLLWRGEWAPGVELECHTNGEMRILFLPGMARIRLDFSRRQCDAVVQPGQERCLRCGCMTHVLCEILGEDNQHVLHAACLAADAKGEKRAVLLAGVCGAGKTTTALSLARAGMRLLTDDAAFLVQRGPTLHIWGLPRPCKVHRRTVEMMDWLKDVESRVITGTEESAVELRRLPSGDPHWELAPGIVLLMEPRNDQEHRLQEMNKVEAITELTRQNVRAMHGLAVERAGRSFHALSSLVINSRVFRLSVGPDLNALHHLLQARLEE